MHIKQTQWWYRFIAEPGKWLQQCFLQPTSFRAYSEDLTWHERVTVMLRICPLIVLFTCPPALLVRAVLCLIDTQLYPDYFLNTFSLNDPGLASFLWDGLWASLISCLLTGLFGALFSLRLGIAAATTTSFATCINNQSISYPVVAVVFGLSFGVVFGVAFNSIGAIKRDGLANVTLGSFIGVLIGLLIGSITGIFGGFEAGALVGQIGGSLWVAQEDNVIGSVAGLATGGILACLFAWLLSKPAYRLFKTLHETVDIGTRVGIAAAGSVGSAVGTVIGDIGMQRTFSDALTTGLWQSGIVGLTFAVLYVIGYYRFPLYPLVALWTVISYHRSNNDRIHALQYLQNSPLYRDECVFLPLPYLGKMLRIIASIDPNVAKKVFHFIVTERRQQIWAVEIVAYEIAMQDIARRKNLTDLALSYRPHSLRQLILPELRQHNRALETLSTQLEAAIEEAENFRMLKSNKATHTASNAALSRMIEHLLVLQAAIGHLSFFTVPRRAMLEKVLERWLNFATEAQDMLNVPLANLAEIPDPYKVGQVLNPFYGGDGINNPLFVGRDAIIASIQTTLQKNPHALFSLTGAHRMGKSSIIAHLPIMLGARYIPINYDISLLIGEFNMLNFLQQFIDELKTHLQRKGLSLQPLELKQLAAQSQQDEDDIYRCVDSWLQRVERWLERHRYVLLITFDEVERLDRRARDTPHFAPLLRWLRKLNLQRPNIALLFCGVKYVYQLGPEWRDHLRNVEPLRIPFLSSDAASKLIRLATSPHTGAVVFPKDIELAIIEATHCHPYLIQALCSILLGILNDTGRDVATEQDMRDARKRLFHKYEVYFIDLWLDCTEDQRLCLLTLRTLTSYRGNELARASDIAETAINQVIGHLIRHDIVINEQGSYRLAVPLFAEWLSDEHYRTLE